LPKINPQLAELPERFLSTAVVLDRTSLSRTALFRYVRTKRFPKPAPLGPRKIAWREREVVEWIAERLRARDMGEGAAERSAHAARSSAFAPQVRAKREAERG
jgi:prophage regulatory protein